MSYRLYAVGDEYNGSTSTALLWKNGVRQVVGTGWASSVFVK